MKLSASSQTLTRGSGEKPRTLFGRQLHPLATLIWQSARLDIVLGLLLSPLHAVCEIALGFVSGALLQLVFTNPADAPLKTQVPEFLSEVVPRLNALNREQLMTAIPALLVVVGFCRMLTSFGSNYLLERAGHRVAHALRLAFLGAYLQASGRVLDTKNPDEATNRILLDTSLLQGLVSKGTIGALRDGLVVLGTVLSMLYLASQLFAVLLVAFVLFFFMLRWISRRLEFFARESARRQVEIATRAIQMRNGLAAIFGMGAQSREREDIQALAEGYYRFAKKTFLLRVGFKPSMEVLAVCVLAGALQWRLHLDGHADLSSYTTLFVLAALAFRPLKNVSSFVSQFSELQSVWRRLVDEWNLMHAFQFNSAQSYEKPVPRAGYALQARELGYQALDDKPILLKCNLEVREGARVVLLGESGSGKSTFLRLAAGLLPVSSGDLAVLRGALLATQHPYVFQGTVFENICYPLLPEGAAAVARARQRALDLVLALMLSHTASGAELFLNKKVGFLGDGLSGGEKARVALARLLFADSRFLLLDEPTANLDAASATSFWAAVWRWQSQQGQSRTVLAVTHDHKELSYFDEAHVFSSGRIVMSGSTSDALSWLSSKQSENVSTTATGPDEK